MIPVWYDPDCDQIWIGDRPEPFPPGTLAYREADGLIHIHRKTQSVSLAAGAYSAFSDANGFGFLSHDEATAYLRGVFARRPIRDIPSASGIATTAIPAGMPVAVSRADNTLVPARADTYHLAFVAGLASDQSLPGFVVTTTRNALTLQDWSVVTGTPSLAVGHPYFLGAKGGLTLAPPSSPGLSSVRVGNATGPQTFAPIEADPILL